MADLFCKIRSREAVGGRRQGQHGPHQRTNSGLVVIDPADLGFAYQGRPGQGFQQVIGDETASMQCSTWRNRSSIPRSMNTILGKLGKERPQDSSLVLCTMTSIRRTRSPLV